MDTTQLLVRMALQAWELQLKRAEKIFNGLTDEQLLQEVAPGRNRGAYLLGHLVAVHDAMFPLLGLGDVLYPSLRQTFIAEADTKQALVPSVPELRGYWTIVNNKLAEQFNAMAPEQWLQRHTAMSDEDWERDPLRNKMSVLMSRTSHVAYHLGQLVFIK
jgi:hypothetical protein